MDIKIPPDFSALLELLNENEVRYAINGGSTSERNGHSRFPGGVSGGPIVREAAGWLRG